MSGSEGGLQVSFWKAVDAIAGGPLFVPRENAIRILAGALSDRQWQRLAEQHPRNGVPARGQLEIKDAA